MLGATTVYHAMSQVLLNITLHGHATKRRALTDLMHARYDSTRMPGLLDEQGWVFQ